MGLKLNFSPKTQTDISLINFCCYDLKDNKLEKVFRPSQTRSTLFWGILLLLIIDVPFFFLLFFSLQGFSILFFVFVAILLLVDCLVLSLSFLGRKMSFKLQENAFSVNFGFSKRKIPYSKIRDVKLAETTLLFRLFGASWPGLHWGLYNAKHIGKVWVYSTKMSGEYVLIDLVNDDKILVSPENPEQLYTELNKQKCRFGTSSEVKVSASTRRLVYLQIVSVAGAFFVFLGYLLWIYPTLPEIIPVHFDLNMIPNRWGHKSELFLIGGIAAIFPIINTILVLKFGKYGKILTIFLGIIFILLMVLFLGMVYFTQSII